jgi:hypothetical protein
MKLKGYLLIILLNSFSAISMAECFYEGKYYPVGAQIGGLICTPEGWI